MIALYVANPSDVSLEALDQVSQERKQRIERCKDLDSKKQMLAAGLLLSKVLRYYGIDENTIQKGPYGKPMAKGIHFNLSHTDGLVVCAVGDSPVGCDVEKIKLAPKGVAGRFFHSNEKEYLKECSENYDREFFRLWTMKESYLKMTGEGMHLPMRDFEVCIGEKCVVWRDGQKVPCFLREYDIPGYQLTVCAKQEAFSELIWEKLV